MNCPPRVLETELWFSWRTGSTVNHWAISPAETYVFVGQVNELSDRVSYCSVHYHMSTVCMEDKLNSFKFLRLKKFLKSYWFRCAWNYCVRSGVCIVCILLALMALLINHSILLSNLQSFLASVVSQAVTAGWVPFLVRYVKAVDSDGLLHLQRMWQVRRW